MISKRERELLEIEDMLGDAMDVAGCDDLERADDFGGWRGRVTEAEDVLGDIMDELDREDDYDDEYDDEDEDF